MTVTLQLGDYFCSSQIEAQHNSMIGFVVDGHIKCFNLYTRMMQYGGVMYKPKENALHQ